MVSYSDHRPLVPARTDSNGWNVQIAPVYKVHAKTEVILTAGAINSPLLLMLSGIGPKDVLAEQGIKTLVESPEVGQQLTVRSSLLFCTARMSQL